MGTPESEMTPLPIDVSAVYDVTSLASDGAGIVRTAEGRVVFVEGAVPGDRVLLEAIARERKVLRARIARIVEASPDRVEPRCLHFGSCGGCDWQNVRYEAQLVAKQQNVRAALERIGGIRLERDVEIVASPDDLHYRARTRVAETEGGVGYRRRGSSETLRVDACPVLVASAQAALVALGSAVAAAQGARGERAGVGSSRPVPRVARRPERGRDRRRAQPSTDGERPREWVITAGTIGAARPYASGATAADVPASPDEVSRGTVMLEVLGERLRVGGPAFVQGNALLWDRFAGEVRDRCLAPIGTSRPQRFVELYAGIGFLTLPLARAGLRGIAVESDRRAVADLAFNLAEAGLSASVEAVAARAERESELATWLAGADLLLVDPPRVGLDARVRDEIARSGPPVVVYVSCDAATLARDLAVLVRNGYRLASVLAFDLFPQTTHVETIVRLER
jgi:23S rRNA (uracil1939-C5)-methyltransferase